MGSNFSNQFKSVFLVTNALLPYFPTKKGVIVNMASIAGLVAGAAAQRTLPPNTQSSGIQNNFPTIMPN